MNVEKIWIDGVIVGSRMRAVDAAKVDSLAASMAAIGLRQPVSVWEDDEKNVHLVAGLHRLRAAEKLGWETIDAIVVDLSDIDRRRWEIAENLHRAELTALERDQHVAEWIRLTEEAAQRQEESGKPKPGQNVQVSKGGRGNKSGISQAARELNIPGKTEDAKRKNAERAVKVSSLTEEAKETAREVGLDDNRSALLKAAKAQEEGKDASEVLRQIAERKSEARRQSTSAAVLADEKRHRLEAPFSDEEIERLRELETDDIRNVLEKLHDLGWSGARRALSAVAV